MSFKIVQVGVARFGQQLTIAAPDLEVEAGDAIQWLVTGVGRSETLVLLASSSTDPGELGPFTFSRADRGVLSAHGTSGLTGTFDYCLAVLGAGGEGEEPRVVAQSPRAALTVRSPGSAVTGRSGQVVLVTYRPNEAGGALEVEPSSARLIDGDPLLFEFRLPKHLFGHQAWVPTILFDQRAGSKERSYGPFASLSVIAGPQSGEPAAGQSAEPLCRRYLIAAGSSGTIGSFHYRAVARAADGSQLVSSPDPVVDNDGEIVCPGC